MRRRAAPFTYMCLSAQVTGRETREHAGRWYAFGYVLRASDQPARAWKRVQAIGVFAS